MKMKRFLQTLLTVMMLVFMMLLTACRGKETDEEIDYQLIDAKEDEQLYSDSLTEMIHKQLEREDFDPVAAAENSYYSGRILVKGEEIDFSEYEIDTVIAAPDGSYVVQFDSEEEAERFHQDQETNEAVEYVEPDLFIELDTGEVSTDVSAEASGSSSSVKANSWGVKYIEADTLAGKLVANGYDSKIVVAVIDTGADFSHSYLKNRLVSGYDYVDGDSNPDEGKNGNGHGTHVAGTIIDCTPGLNVKIMPVRALNREGKGYSSAISASIRYAADSGAKVINMSLGGEGHSSSIDSAVSYAVNRGVTVCVAAGNKNINTSGYCPAHITTPGSITVSAIDNKGKKASFSNYGSAVDVAAPGVSISSCIPGGKFGSKNGTSMATPHVSAVAAMFTLMDDSLTPAQIEAMICKYTKDLGASGKDQYYGNGVNKLGKVAPKALYTVTYNANGGTISLQNEEVQEGNSVKLPTPSKTPYTIRYDANGGNGAPADQKVEQTCIGWATKKDAASAEYSCGSQYKPAKSLTLYALWPTSASAKVSSTIPTRTGWIFEGWSLGRSDSSVKYTSGAEVSVTKDMTLYAVWRKEPTMYTITFDGNGGTVSTDSVRVEEGSSVYLPVPSKGTYKVRYDANGGSEGPVILNVKQNSMGWSTKKTAAAAEYSCGSQYTPSASTTLYAIWPASYTATISSSIPTRTGWSFIGWSTSSSAASGEYLPGEEISLSKDMTLYAVWSKDAATYTVAYDANGGSGAPAGQTKVEKINLVLSETVPTRSGYRFLGWSTSKTATTATYAPGASYQTDAAATLYAVWKQIPTMAAMPNMTVRVNEVVTKNNPVVTPNPSGYQVSCNSNVIRVVENGGSYTVTGLKEGTATFTITATVDGETVSQQCKVTVPTASITLSSTSGSGEQSAAHTNTEVLHSYTTSPTSQAYSDYFGWAVSLPNVSINNLASGSYPSGWEVVSGNVVFSNNKMYIGQPGTVKVRYCYGGRYSPVYTYTLKIYKTTTASNILRSAPGSDTSIGSVPGNTTVYLQQVAYVGTLEQVGCKTYGKVTYGGKTGWIILTEWK